MIDIRLVRSVGAAFLFAGFLAACASTGPLGPGATREQVQSRWGEPRASYALPSGQRLFYRQKPGELERLDFDANGRLLKMEQVFTAEHFHALAKGHWTAADVQSSFGPPSRRLVALAADNQEDAGYVWVYSWLDFGTWRLAQLSINGAGAVQSVEFLVDPQADDRYR